MGVLLLPVMLFIIQNVTCQYLLIVPLETGSGMLIIILSKMLIIF